MQSLPFYVYLLFAVAVLFTVVIGWACTPHNRRFIVVVLLWLTLQSALGVSGFYTVTNTVPPRFPLLIVPPLVFLLVGLFTRKGQVFIDGIDVKKLTLLHIVRVPVEVVLYWLSVHKAVPVLLTFEGNNFDIFSGISAPLIYYWGFVKGRIGNRWIIVWNVGCLLLLMNIVVSALLSAPTPMQQLAFDQPNIAVSYFPFVLLPSVIVPMVLMAHAVTIRGLLKTQGK